MSIPRLPFASLLLLAGLVTGPTAHAETFHTCAGFIDSVPTTISTQGVWCLRHDLSTNIASGAAITIAANNVTIDCNDFKLGGLAAGDSSAAMGISANARQNATVRHCNIRGFNYGIFLYDGAGHRIEDNRLDNNLYAGIFVVGDHMLVQRNQVFDTGGRVGSSTTIGIHSAGDILDNTVDGVFSSVSGAYMVGIDSLGLGAQVRGNRVYGLAATSPDYANGIVIFGSYRTVDDNRVLATGLVNGVGIFGDVGTFCRDNTVSRFTTAFSNCAVSSGNLSQP